MNPCFGRIYGGEDGRDMTGFAPPKRMASYMADFVLLRNQYKDALIAMVEASFVDQSRMAYGDALARSIDGLSVPLADGERP